MKLFLNKPKQFVLFIGILIIASQTMLMAQSQKCGTTILSTQKIKKKPDLKFKIEETERQTQYWLNEQTQILNKKTSGVITIPVVVHVLYHFGHQNISDAKIKSQIEVLNKDFRFLNSDILPSTHAFYNATADSEIEFCLANIDPNGNATNGITRTYTDTISFKEYNNEKSSTTGGEDNWNPRKYLNIWVCLFNHPEPILGYATVPALLDVEPEKDGVSIDYRYFGTLTPAIYPYNLGRTTTHEIGHWLNLNHIWGDDECGNDLVADTEVAKEANYGKPTFPHNANSSCGTDMNGEMFMNYMDYVDDSCMNMFTKGQAARMNATLNTSRLEILTSNGCSGTNNINPFLFNTSFSIYPNPSQGQFIINGNLPNAKAISFEVYTIQGICVKNFINCQNLPYQFDLNGLPKGIYLLKINSEQNVVTKKITVTE